MKRREFLKAFALLLAITAELFFFADGFWERRAEEGRFRASVIAAEGGMTE